MSDFSHRPSKEDLERMRDERESLKTACAHKCVEICNGKPGITFGELSEISGYRIELLASVFTSMITEDKEGKISVKVS